MYIVFKPVCLIHKLSILLIFLFKFLFYFICTSIIKWRIFYIAGFWYHNFMEHTLSCMTKRCVSKIMPESNCFRKICIKAKSSSYRSRNLSYFQGMC